MTGRGPCLALALLLALPATPAVADTPEAEVRYREGQAAFEAGQLERALAAFESAHALDPKPELLINMAQCQRGLGRRKEAVALFQQFVTQAPKHRLRAATERTIEELLREESRAAPRDPLSPAPREASPNAPEAALPGGQEPAAVVEAPRSRMWLWIGLGAVALAGAGTAVYFGARAGTPPSLGTLKLPPP